MGRTPSPEAAPAAPSKSRSVSPKTKSNRVQKKTSEKDPLLAEKLQHLTPEQFVKFFQLRGDKVAIYVGCHMPAYNIPRKLLVEKSAYFAEKFKDTPWEITRIDMEDKDAFESILQNMYTDKITLPDYAHLKPSKAISKYLDIITLTSFLQLSSDLLARNAATAIWTILREHPSKIRNRHLKVIFGEEWPKGWAFDNVRKEFVKEIAEQWVDNIVGGTIEWSKEKGYDLEGIMKRDGEVPRLVLEAVGVLLKKRAYWTGLHPLTGKALPMGEEEAEAEAGEELEEEQDEEETPVEVPEAESAEEEWEGCYENLQSDLHASIAQDVSENGRYFEVTNQYGYIPPPATYINTTSTNPDMVSRIAERFGAEAAEEWREKKNVRQRRRASKGKPLDQEL